MKIVRDENAAGLEERRHLVPELPRKADVVLTERSVLGLNPSRLLRAQIVNRSDDAWVPPRVFKQAAQPRPANASGSARAATAVTFRDERNPNGVGERMRMQAPPWAWCGFNLTLLGEVTRVHVEA